MLAITADGASTNRLLFTLLSSSNDIDVPESEMYKIPNPYTDEDRSIYFLSDPPHLLKTIRNCVASKKRNLKVYFIARNKNVLSIMLHDHLQNKGKKISWSHIDELYKGDSGAVGSAAGLCLLPKLKYEHVHLNNFSKMRVDLAAQVRVQI